MIVRLHYLRHGYGRPTLFRERLDKSYQLCPAQPVRKHVHRILEFCLKVASRLDHQAGHDEPDIAVEV